MDLSRLLTVIRLRWWLLALAAVTAGALAYIVSSNQAQRFEASADLLFGHTSSADTVVVGGGTSDTAAAPPLSAATNLALASLDTVAARVHDRVGGSASVNDLKSAVSVTPKGTSDVVTVTADWTTAPGAAAVANAFADEVVKLRRETAQREIQRAIDSVNARITPPAGSAAAGVRLSRAQLRTLRSRVSQLELLKALETGDVQVVERATPPASASSPRPLRTTVLGGFLGLILGALAAVLLAALDQRIRSEDELVSLLGAPVLARIPRAAGSRRLRSGTSSHADPSFIEAFQFLRMNLQLMGPATPRAHGPGGEAPGNGHAPPRPLPAPTSLDPALTLAVAGGYTHPALGGEVRKTRGGVTQVLNRLAKQQTDVLPSRSNNIIAVTSPAMGDGKTTVVAWLAHSLASTGSPVVAVDLDRRHPMLQVVFDIQPERGKDVLTALLDAVDAGDLTQPTLFSGLRVLPGSEATAAPSTQIGEGRIRQLLDEVRRDASYVLVDTSPVTTVADASAVAAAADGVILVVDLRRIRRRELLAAKQQLTNAQAAILGIAINNAPVA